MTERDQPPKASAETPHEDDQPVIVISNEELEAARQDPRPQEFLRLAIEQEERLERESLIHP